MFLPDPIRTFEYSAVSFASKVSHWKLDDA